MNCLNQHIGENFTIWNADCCEVLNALPENSIHLSIFSPPYASLYTYRNSDRDLGNSASDAQFYEHFYYVVAGRALVIPSKIGNRRQGFEQDCEYFLTRIFGFLHLLLVSNSPTSSADTKPISNS